MKTEKTRQHIHTAIAAAQHEIDEERDRREEAGVWAVFAGVAGLVFPPALGPALAAAGGLALKSNEHHQNVIDRMSHVYLSSSKIHTYFLQSSMGSNPGWPFQMIRIAS